jgi:hypothetical protein
VVTPVKALPDLVRSLSVALGHRRVAPELLPRLWSFCLQRAAAEIGSFPAIRCLCDLFDDFIGVNEEWEDFGGILELLKTVWNHHANEVNFIEVLSPLYLLVASRSLEILEFDFDILAVICGALAQREFKWDFVQMVQNLITIYDKVGSLHILSQPAALVLVSFLALDATTLKRLAFTRAIRARMLDVTRELIERDARALEYIQDHCPEESAAFQFVERHLLQ